MGSYYRDRHQGATSTTSDDLPGLTGNESTATAGVFYEDMTLAELRELAEARGLKSYGSKADIIERIQADDTA